MRKTLFLFLLSLFFSPCMGSNPSSVKWDRISLIVDGKRTVPVMGEIHYSRIPADEWNKSIKEMKKGGVTIIATYVFWNHIEEEEGIFRWDGQRCLRAFLEECKKEGMPVILRIGPFCHGEARNGGLPDWLFHKGCRIRSLDTKFLSYVEGLYRQIYSQIIGLQWKDGGPLIACQFDNEYRGSGDYLMKLKEIALKIGYDLPFYTRTGWPELTKPVPYGEIIPLYGDYADGFWDKDITEGAGNYWKAFHFKEFRSSTAIGTDLLGKQDETTNKEDNNYPYFTCELGGGMVKAYHKRPFMYPEDALAMAIVKLGSGSNLLGYYMYHGGTNPDGRLTTLNETQRTPGTANNDLPVKSYEFQAPLSEFGQRQPVYYRLRPLHLFLHDFGDLLAPMEVVSPNSSVIEKGDDSQLRWTYRKDQNGSAFVFVNNYERFQHLSSKKNIQFNVEGEVFPQKPISIPESCSAVFPVNVRINEVQLQYSTAQLVSRHVDSINGNTQVYLMQIDGIPSEIKVNGKVMKNVKPRGINKAVFSCGDVSFYLLSRDDAEHLYLDKESPKSSIPLSYKKIKDADSPRVISKGPAKVAEAPTDSDFNQAAVYVIDIPETTNGVYPLLDIEYRGDCARLYCNGKLIDDNFYNGLHFMYGLWRLPSNTRQLELRILPLQPDAPIYLPKEAVKQSGEELISVTIKQ